MANQIFRKKSITTILKDAESGLHDGHSIGLKKVLGVRDLTFFGVAAVIGAGIFSGIGQAASDGGPGVVFLYAFTAIACGFAALCYAEFASTVPVSGSAYTYSYVAFGEIFAWIIGWDLLMEYAIGNIAVAISWSDYFTNLMTKAGLHIPDWMTMDYMTAKAGATESAVSAWADAPNLFGLRLIMDVPALLIVALITYIVFRGIKESRSASNLMVIIKLCVIFFVIVLGAYYVNPSNWSPFTPEGFGGIMKGVSAVFFAYIGFDAISTTAEECKDPQRDLPRGMIYSLIICTVVYVLLALVLTGMVHYSKLRVGDPLAMVFDERGMKFIGGIVAVSAIIATASVLLVFQLGQPRIWMSMSRDGLLPKIFSRIHKKYGTPSFSTILTGFVVAVPALFLNLSTVLSLTSIGTLFAFVLVCGGVLVLQKQKDRPESKFKVPFVNAQLIYPLVLIAAIVLIAVKAPSHFTQDIWTKDTWPMAGFWIIAIIMAVLAFINKLSLLPILGMISCFYLMAQETHTVWMRFLIWLTIGLAIYFTYSYSASKLKKKDEVMTSAPHAAGAGLSLLAFCLLVYFHNPHFYENRDTLIIYLAVGVTVQFFYSYWAARVAKKLGLNPVPWQLSTLIFTIPSLIALGFQKKK
ncbi:MAG TPA: amino acid permease [Chitinophagaceae bacterium]|nr:amino acid permease [Chitinophagaceae bacterium]